ncbi:nucleotidyltransferase domain-containing protein [Candidatus Bathyarchaeota archaeon]|nr:nucleotidyltransferase domain-containing protein [Candidatus Bathyarchaeota archaeon]
MPKIAEAAKTLMPDARIYIFGSIVKGEAVGGSDIDVLIISKDIPKSNIERAKIKIKIEEFSKLPSHSPFEFHLANEEEMKWYLKIKELKEYKLI